MTPPDLIFVSMEDWDDVWRRNQFVCAELTRRHPDLRILFVGRPLDVSNGIRRGRFAGWADRATRPAPGFPAITLTHPPKALPNSIAAGRRANEWLFRRHVRRAAARLGVRRPVLWLNPHYAVHMVGRMGERAVVYDVTDDWTTFPQRPRVARLIARQDQTLCRRADATIVCSPQLSEMKRPISRELHLIPNGVDAVHYRAVLDWAGPLPTIVAGWERPVYGYTGSIHPARVDIDLIAAVARRLTKGTFALVGPDMLPPADRARLQATGRVVLAGSVPYADLPQHMRAFDACVVPHRVTPFTESLNPIKLWEYLAAGKPIVSTPVAGFRDFPELVHLAGTSDAFVAALGRALAEDQATAVRRREEAAKHSWASRVDQIERVLETVCRRPDRRRTLGRE